VHPSQALYPRNSSIDLLEAVPRYANRRQLGPPRGPPRTTPMQGKGSCDALGDKDQALRQKQSKQGVAALATWPPQGPVVGTVTPDFTPGR
jgi:hypothetical protein